MSGSKRIEWIDVAKGVGIVLVSFGHLRNGDGESVWLPALDAPIDAIYLFHMLISVSFGSRLRRACTHVPIPFAISSAFSLPTARCRPSSPDSSIEL